MPNLKCEQSSHFEKNFDDFWSDIWLIASPIIKAIMLGIFKTILASSVAFGCPLSRLGTYHMVWVSKICARELQEVQTTIPCGLDRR
jgi:hypothetical protein